MHHAVTFQLNDDLKFLIMENALLPCDIVKSINSGDFFSTSHIMPPIIFRLQTKSFFFSIACTSFLKFVQAAVLLVDSQGTGDNRRSDVKLDTLIMYISLQLSSVQVLNVEKYLTSDVMISLQVICYYQIGGRGISPSSLVNQY